MTEQPDILQRLTAAASQLLDARIAQEEAQAKLDAAAAVVEQLEKKLIPDLMADADMSTFTTKEGLHITLAEDFRTNTKSPDLHQWLRDNGNGGLIKTVVAVPFNKGGDEEARALVAELAEREITSDCIQDVNWQSLQTLLRDMRKKGEELPLAQLNIHLIPKVTVKLPKK